MKNPRIRNLAAIGVCLLLCASAARASFASLWTFPDFSPTGMAYAGGRLYGVGVGSALPVDCGSVFALEPPALPALSGL